MTQIEANVRGGLVIRLRLSEFVFMCVCVHVGVGETRKIIHKYAYLLLAFHE